MTSSPPASPAPIWDVINGFSSYWALLTALDLGVFDALAEAGEAGLDSGGLAEAVGAAEPDSVALLAQTLVALGLLGASGTNFTLTPAATRYLVSSSAASMAALVRYSPGPHRAWPQLADRIRTGAVEPSIAAELITFYPELVRATAPTQSAVAAAVAAELDRRGWWPAAPAVLDLGCGSGAWLTALLSGRPDATALAIDLPNVAPIAEQAATAAGLADRVSVLAGDYLATELPAGPFDLVVLAHVLRAEPVDRAQQLLSRAIELAGPSGVVVVADYPRPEPAESANAQSTNAQSTNADPAASYAAARHELLLSLTMLSSTAGQGISVGQLSQWAEAAGAELSHSFEAIPRQHVYLIRSRRTEGTS